MLLLITLSFIKKYLFNLILSIYILKYFKIFLYKIIILILNKLYFNFYKILLKGYKVIGGRKRYILVKKTVHRLAPCTAWHELLKF